MKKGYFFTLVTALLLNPDLNIALKYSWFILGVVLHYQFSPSDHLNLWLFRYQTGKLVERKQNKVSCLRFEPAIS